MELKTRFISQIAVVGSADLELSVRMTHVPKAGECVMAEDLRVRPSGRAAEVAAALSRLGSRVFFYSCIGLDPFGVRILTDLRRENVNVDFVERHRDISTGIVHRFATPDGESRGVHTPGSGMYMSEKGLELGKAMIAASDLMVIYPDIPENTFHLALRMANHYRVPVLLDPTPASCVPKEFLSKVDIITPNRAEAEAFTGSKIGGTGEALEAARRIARFGVGAVALTLGRHGCALATGPKDARYMPAPRADGPSDGRRPGDIFIAVLAAKLAARGSFSEACLAALNLAVRAERLETSGFPDFRNADRFLRIPNG